MTTFVWLKGLKWKVLVAALLLLSAVCVVLAVSELNSGLDGELSNETSPSPTGVQVEATRYPFNLTMTIEKTEFAPNESVKIIFRLKHIGNETLIMSFADGGDQFYFIVYNETNSIVFILTLYYGASVEPMEVEPGEEINCTHVWRQDGTALWYPGCSYDEKVPPGTYHIVGVFSSSTLTIEKDWWTIETPPVTIKILEE